MVKVKFFAWLKEEIQEEIVLELTGSVTINELKDLIILKIPAAKILHNESILSALNLEFVDSECVVNNNDEVAFFPPVTGG